MCSQQNNRIRAGNSSISSSPGQFCFPERNGFLSRHFLRRAHQDHADHNDDRGSKNSYAQLFSGQRPAQKNRDDWINVRVSRNQQANPLTVQRTDSPEKSAENGAGSAEQVQRSVLRKAVWPDQQHHTSKSQEDSCPCFDAENALAALNPTQ